MPLVVSWQYDSTAARNVTRFCPVFRMCILSPGQPGQVQVQGSGSGLVVSEKLLSHRPLLESEIREGEEAKLSTQQDMYDEGRSGMAMELSYRTKEFMEAKSSMESLEEELKNAPLQ